MCEDIPNGINKVDFIWNAEEIKMNLHWWFGSPKLNKNNEIEISYFYLVGYEVKLLIDFI